MVYGVVKIINGNFEIHSEGFTDLNKAKISYHGFLTALYNDLESVDTFAVMIMNSGGGIVEIDTYVKPDVEPVIEDIPAEDIPAEVEV